MRLQMKRRSCKHCIINNFRLRHTDDGTRQRRRRTTFTDEQLDRLEETFGKEKFPGIQIREDLARELNIGEDRIQVTWVKLSLNQLQKSSVPFDTRSFRQNENTVSSIRNISFRSYSWLWYSIFTIRSYKLIDNRR